MKRFFISCTCVMMLCTGAMAANWESNHETLSGNYLFSLKNPAAASGSMWDYATLDTLSTFIKSELTGQDVTFGTIYFTDLISLSADGTHGLEALNTVAITRDPNNLALAPLTDRWWVANGTDWTSNWLLMWSDVGVTIPSYNDIATSGLTFVTTDPTAASENGQYINTTDAGRWSKSDDWLCEDGVGCDAIYTVTLTEPTNGDVSSATLGLDTATGDNSVDVLTGTGPVTDWVFTPDSGYECDSVTGFDSGDCTGASLTVDGDETLGVSFASTGVSDIIVDNEDATGFATVGTWEESSFTTGFYGTNYSYSDTGDGSNTATWTINLASSASYELFCNYTGGSDRASLVPYTILNNDTPVGSTVYINQRENGGSFVSLGTYSLTAGTLVISIDNSSTGGYTIADAIKVVAQ